MGFTEVSFKHILISLASFMVYHIHWECCTILRCRTSGFVHHVILKVFSKVLDEPFASVFSVELKVDYTLKMKSVGSSET